MEFKPEKVEDFLKIFEESKHKIANFEGCKALSLFVDQAQKNVLYTVSKWESIDNLENYRKSELFQETWTKTKNYFNGKPLAYSLEIQSFVKDESK